MNGVGGVILCGVCVGSGRSKSTSFEYGAKMLSNVSYGRDVGRGSSPESRKTNVSTEFDEFWVRLDNCRGLGENDVFVSIDDVL